MERSPEIVSIVDNAVNRRLAFFSFWEYCLYQDNDFFSRRPFFKEVADAFQWIYDEYIAGRPRRASVSMPPRAGKSYITSLFCAWWLGKLSELSVMRNTCTARLYRKFSYDVRKIIRSAKFRSVFPDVEMSKDMANVEGWSLTKAKQVSYFGAGVGGTIIGFGANLAISDDLYKDMEDALSENTREGVQLWKESAHDSRKERNCPEIFIGTRWTKRDEIGRAIDSGKINKEVSIKALTPDGVTFCDDVKTTEEYVAIKNDIDETIWEAEYQQEPIENKGLLFPKSELKFYKRSHVDFTKPDYTLVQIDPADTGGDFYAAPLAYLIDDRVYISKVIFNTSGTDITTPDTVEMIISNKADHVNVEGNSAWTLLGKQIRGLVSEKLEDCEVRIHKNSTSKETRILAQSAWIRNHVYFDEEYAKDREYKAFIKNLTEYLREGGNKHDDAPDVLADLANYFRKNFSHLW